jgi:EAL domain-containing protein (putative c-di-GMP-specific phosphodiesterase class I)
MRHACQQLKAWTQKFPTLPDLTMSVNISAQQLVAPELLPTITQVIQDTGIKPSSLVLEITESVVIKNAEAAIKVLNQIREIGVKLHMDDFGTDIRR